MLNMLNTSLSSSPGGQEETVGGDGYIYGLNDGMMLPWVYTYPKMNQDAYIKYVWLFTCEKNRKN